MTEYYTSVKSTWPVVVHGAIDGLEQRCQDLQADVRQCKAVLAQDASKNLLF